MEVYRHPLTGQAINASVVPGEIRRPVRVTAEIANLCTTIWMTPGEALAIAAIAVGVDPRQMNSRARRIDPDLDRNGWDFDDLYDLIGEHLATFDDLDSARCKANAAAALDALLAAADEAEATEVER